MWWLWRWRNDLVFSNAKKCNNFKIAWIKSKVQEIEQAFSQPSIVSGVRRCHVTKYFGWLPPQQGWIKLNTDGCCKGVHELAGGGGVLRDENGAWLFGFMYNIGTCTAIESELWAVLIGLRLAWSKSYRQVILEVDSAVVVQWLNAEIISSVLATNLLELCRQELRKNWDVHVLHIYRERNRVADGLASAAIQCARGLHILDGPPSSLHHILLEDRLGVSWPRKVSIIRT